MMDPSSIEPDMNPACNRRPQVVILKIISGYMESPLAANHYRSDLKSVAANMLDFPVDSW